MVGGLAKYTAGAKLLAELRRLRPGQAARLEARDLLDIVVPANPLDRQTPEFLARWFHARLPFNAELEGDPLKRHWTIRRPPAEPVAATGWNWPWGRKAPPQCEPYNERCRLNAPGGPVPCDCSPPPLRPFSPP